LVIHLGNRIGGGISGSQKDYQIVKCLPPKPPSIKER